MYNMAALGSFCFGVVLGWLVRYFIKRFKSFTPKTLSSIVSVMSGGVVIRFLGAGEFAWWFYPIGLLAGFVLYSVLALWAIGFPISHSKSTKGSRSKSQDNGGHHCREDDRYNGILYRPRSDRDD